MPVGIADGYRLGQETDKISRFVDILNMLCGIYLNRRWLTLAMDLSLSNPIVDLVGQINSMDTVDVFSMRDVERLTGIKAHTIRVWEKRYGIPEPQRTTANIRYYNNDEVRLLLTIGMLSSHGHKISAIAAMSVDERNRLLNEALEMRANPGHVEQALLISLLEVDECRFARIFYSIVLRLGLEQAFAQCLLPFFERVGILWQTGAIEPAQEHFFFNLVRQKLIAGTENLGTIQDKAKPAVLLFLPEHELHELGLLFYNYAFRARGYRTFYLGQSVPFAGLERIIRLSRPDYIVTGMTSTINPKGFDQLNAEMRRIAGNIPIFYTGPVPSGVKESIEGLLVTDDLILFLNSLPCTIDTARPLP